MNSFEKNFIQMVEEKCDKHSILFLPKKTKTIKINGVFVNGYFEASDDGKYKGTLAYALNSDEGIGLLAHEFSHMEQHIEQIDLWVKLQNDTSVDDWLGGDPIENIFQKIDETKWLELDCEKRTVKNIKKYSLSVDIPTYIQRANSYILFHNYMKETRKWCRPGNTPYSKKNKALWSLCPSKFMPMSWYEKIPKKIYKKFIEFDI